MLDSLKKHLEDKLKKHPILYAIVGLIFAFVAFVSALIWVSDALSIFSDEKLPTIFLRLGLSRMSPYLSATLLFIFTVSSIGLFIAILRAVAKHRKEIGWLEALANEDSNQLPNRLLINEKPKKAVLSLNAISPHAILRMFLFNSSVYTLTLEKEVEGKVFFLGAPLPDEARIHRTKDLDKKVEIKHGEYYPLELYQHLQPSVIDHIQKAKGRAEFGVGKVAVWVTYQDHTGITQRKRISLGSTFFSTDSNAKDTDIIRLEERLSERDGKIAMLNSKVKELLKEKGTHSIYFEFPEAELDRPSANYVLAFVKITSLITRTTLNVSVHIVSVVKVDEPKQPDYERHLQTLAGLPLIIHGEGVYPPFHQPRSEIEIHPGDAAMFNLVTLQRGTAQSSPATILWHAAGFQHTDPVRDEWRARPQATLLPGHYRVQLKVQGRDTSAETTTIEFMNIRDEMWIRQVE